MQYFDSQFVKFVVALKRFRRQLQRKYEPNITYPLVRKNQNFGSQRIFQRKGGFKIPLLLQDERTLNE